MRQRRDERETRRDETETRDERRDESRDERGERACVCGRRDSITEAGPKGHDDKSIFRWVVVLIVSATANVISCLPNSEVLASSQL